MIGKLFSAVAVAMLLEIGLDAVRIATVTPADCGVPRIGWSSTPPDGEIQTLFWATTGFSEVWLTITPEQPARGRPGVPNLLLVFSICVPGKAIRSPQPSAQLRVQVNRNFPAALVPDPKLEILFDDVDRHDLTGPSFTHSTEFPPQCSPGDSCAYSAVLVDLPIAFLRRMTIAGRVRGTLSETPFELTTTDRHKLDAFVQRITLN